MRTEQKYISIALALLSLMTSGCVINDMKQSTDDMKQSTDHMKQSTDDMNSTTKAMEKKTSDLDQKMDKLAETTDSLDKKISDLQTNIIAPMKDDVAKTGRTVDYVYWDLRPDQALAIRTQHLDELRKVDDLNAKIFAAGAYCEAFEFQLWKGEGRDTQDYLDALASDGLEEFFMRLREFTSDPTVATDPTSSKNNTKNLLALSAVLERVASISKNQPQLKDHQQLSLLDMLEEALAKSDDVETGKIAHEDLTLAEQQVLRYQDYALNVLETRANFLPLVALSFITDVQSHSLPVQAYMAYVGTKAQLGGIEAMRSSLDYLKKANDVIRFLRKIHYNVRFDGTVKAFYKNLRLSAPGTSARSMNISVDERQARASVEAGLLNEINTFKQLANLSQ
jgi:hypothetical protein